MKPKEDAAASRRRLQTSLLAAHAAQTVTRAELTTAKERARLAAERQRQAEQKHTQAVETYRSLTAEYRASAALDVSPSRHPAAPMPPIDTYEGCATAETFSILHIIDNDEPLYMDKIKRFEIVLRSNHRAEENRKNGHTEPAMIARIWRHLDDHGHATPESLDLYASLIAAALHISRKLREPIDLANVDIDDLVAHLASDLAEYAETWTYIEPTPTP